LVFWTACSSLSTVSLSLLTAAFAEARLASRVAVLTVALEEDEPEPSLVVEARSFVVEPRVVGVLLGVVAVGVTVSVLELEVVGVVVVVVVFGVVVLGAAPVVVVGAVVVGAVAVGTPLAAGAATVVETSSVLAGCTDAVEALAVAELAEPPVVVPSPSVSSSLARFASAESRLAFACSSVTSELCGSSVASSSPWVTCSPWVTYMSVTVPLVLKPRLSWLAACRLPLPDTVDWTTPAATVAVRVTVVVLPEAGPTTRTAATIAAAQRAPSA